MNSLKKKILLIGPIGDFGGRELECGFIASALSSQYEVSICSTGTISEKSQLFDFNRNQKVFSIKELLFSHFFLLKFLALFSFFKNSRKGKPSNYVNNAFAKKFFGYDKKVQTILEQLISGYDAIFIMAHLSSGLMDDVIRIAKNKKIKVLFRTTGAITFSGYDFISSVDCFIHHSVNNAGKIEKTKNHKYIIVDQCAYNEKDLLNIPVSNREVCNFLILSRLSAEKGIEEIIDFFLRVSSENDTLFIAGNGVLETYLKTKFKEAINVKFIGFLSGTELSDLFGLIDCLIVSSFEESGPLVGIESMCAGKIVISTRVGAMEERMQESLNDYWFNYGDFESFEKVFFEVKRLNELQIRKVSSSLREKYQKEYSINKIKNKYLAVVREVLYL